MHPWRTGSYHNPIDPQFLNVILDEILPRVGAHISIVARNHNVRKRCSIPGHLFHVHYASDV
jgi:hypothetical protein